METTLLSLSPGFILGVYLALLLTQLGVDLWLDYLNLSYCKGRRGSMPGWLAPHLDEAGYGRAIEYTLAKGRVGVVSTVVAGGFLATFSALGGFGAVERGVVSVVPGRLLGGVVYLMVLSTIMSLVALPFSLYSTFVVEERFGFNKTTLKLWLVDLVKGLLLSAVLLAPLLLVVLVLMEKAGASWWIWTFLVIAAFQLSLVYLFPVVIAPLFNRFSSLEEGALRRAIEELAERVGFGASGVYVMDGSRRSSHGNAYFTGFGRNKRIVLFDTLINELSAKQIVAVLAHEIGHEKRRHIKIAVAVSLGLLFLSLFVTSRLVSYDALFHAFGFAGRSSHALLALALFLSGPVSYFLMPLLSMLSRKHEYEADRFAVDAVGNGDDLSGALLQLSKKSLANPVPHPLYSFFHYSHPTLGERIEAMAEYEASRKDGPESRQWRAC